MSRWTRLIPGIAIAALLAACGESATDTLFAPAGPSRDGGYIIGGNRTEPSDSTTTAISSSSTGDPGVAEGDSTREGGYIIGGN